MAFWKTPDFRSGHGVGGVRVGFLDHLAEFPPCPTSHGTWGKCLPSLSPISKVERRLRLLPQLLPPAMLNLAMALLRPHLAAEASRAAATISRMRLAKVLTGDRVWASGLKGCTLACPFSWASMWTLSHPGRFPQTQGLKQKMKYEPFTL